jgi:hypothetical protein
MTLFINTAEVGCAGKAEPASSSSPAAAPRNTPPAQQTTNASDDDAIVPRHGYQILIGQAEWPPSVETGILAIFSFDEDKESVMGRGVYFAILTLALVGFILGLSSWLQRRLPLFLLRLLKTLALLISLLMICEFSGPTLLIFGFWLLPLTATLVALLLLLGLRSRPETRAKLRRGLVISLIPLVFANLVYLGTVFRALYGLSVLYLAAHALTVGFVLLVEHRRPAITPINSPLVSSA